MDCKTALGLLEAYLDKELDRSDARALEAHVDGCADCRMALTRLDELRLALRERSLRYVAPTSLRDRIAAAATGSGETPADSGSGDSGFSIRHRVTSRVAPWWGRLAAACVLAFGAGAASVHLWNSGQGDSGQWVAHDLFASHWRALAAASPVDVVSSDRHTVKPWFAGKVAQAPLVRDFAEQGFPLAGGRIDYVGAQRVPVLVYRHGAHLIDVFVLPASMAVAADESQGSTLRPVVLGGQPAAVVSDMDAREIAAFSHLLSE